MPKDKKISRRKFLKNSSKALGILSLPYIVPSKVLAKPGSIPPSDKIVIGCIGIGMQGSFNTKQFLGCDDARVIAICDIDKNNLEIGVNLVNEKYGNNDCLRYHDFREIIARDDIDVISIAVPDHWHAIGAIAAARAGKDIFGEKPLSHNFNEGLAICEAVKRYGRIWQTGSWQRSLHNFRFACELVLNGRIGKVHTVEVGLPSGHTDFAGTAHLQTICPPPKELDYETWLGPAPWAPYCPARTHKNWRWIMDYGGGQLMDWIGHHADIAHWGLGLDYSGPLEIEGYGEYARTGLYNSPTRFRLTAKYPRGITMIIAGGHDDIRRGTKWIGDDGWVWVSRSGFETQPANLMYETFSPDEINLYRSPGHFRNFLDCVKTRQTTLCPAEIAHRSATPGHLGNIAMTLGRKIRFNPETQQIIGDDTATRLLGNAMRSPWHL